MLPLIRTTDTIDIVCNQDPSVKVKDREVCGWLPLDGTKTDGKATTVTVRALSSSELLRCQGFLAESAGGGVDLTIHAAWTGTIAVNGPDLHVDEPSEVRDVLDRLAPAALASLGSYVLNRSLETEDPTEASV